MIIISCHILEIRGRCQYSKNFGLLVIDLMMTCICGNHTVYIGVCSTKDELCAFVLIIVSGIVDIPLDLAAVNITLFEQRYCIMNRVCLVQVTCFPECSWDSHSVYEHVVSKTACKVSGVSSVFKVSRSRIGIPIVSFYIIERMGSFILFHRG